MPREPLGEHEQLIVREGLDASSLLASEALRSIFKSIQVEAFARFTESAPDQKDARENLYNLTQGLKAIEEALNMRVQAKDEIERRLDAEAASDANDDLIDDATLGDPDEL